MLLMRVEVVSAGYANAPLLLGSVSHPALSSDNQRWVNFKPHPGVFLDRPMTYPGAGTWLGPVKAPVKKTFGRGSCSGDMHQLCKSTPKFLHWKSAEKAPLLTPILHFSVQIVHNCRCVKEMSSEPNPNVSKYLCRCECIPTHAATLSLFPKM